MSITNFKVYPYPSHITASSITLGDTGGVTLGVTKSSTIIPYSLIFPSSIGTSGQVLKLGTNGELEWENNNSISYMDDIYSPQLNAVARFMGTGSLVSATPILIENNSSISNIQNLNFNSANGGILSVSMPTAFTGTTLPTFYLPIDAPSADTFLANDGTGNTSWGNPMPTGCILSFGLSAAPNGWLICDGAAVSRTTYLSLFAAISTTFGVGDGSTTFNLPNMTNRFGRMKSTTNTIGDLVNYSTASPTTTAFTTGATSTSSSGTHTHTIGLYGDTGGTTAAPPSGDSNSGQATGSTISYDGLHTHPIPSLTLSGGDTETAPMHIVLLYCIKI